MGSSFSSPGVFKEASGRHVIRDGRRGKLGEAVGRHTWLGARPTGLQGQGESGEALRFLDGDIDVAGGTGGGAAGGSLASIVLRGQPSCWWKLRNIRPSRSYG